MCQPNSKILKSYCEYSCSLPAVKPAVCPLSVVTLPWPGFPHLTRLLTSSLPDSSSLPLSLSLSLCRLPSKRRIFFRVLSDVPSLDTFSVRCQSIFFPLPPSPPTLEYSWLSRLTPLWFIPNPSLAKSQFSSQLFRSANENPNVFAIQSYLSFNAPMRRHATSVRRNTPLSTIVDCGNLPFALFTSECTSTIT